MIERQLERYRRLLYGATDALLVEGLRKLIDELEARLEASREAEEPPLPGDTQMDLFLRR